MRSTSDGQTERLNVQCFHEMPPDNVNDPDGDGKNLAKVMQNQVKHGPMLSPFENFTYLMTYHFKLSIDQYGRTMVSAT